jgi:hypothetical protein
MRRIAGKGMVNHLPAMISEDESVRIFDRHIVIPRSRSRTCSARICVATSNDANLLKPSASLPRKRGPRATAAGLGSLDFGFAMITPGYLRSFTSTLVPAVPLNKRGGTVKKSDTDRATMCQGVSRCSGFAADIRSRLIRDGGAPARGWGKYRGQFRDQFIRIQLRFNSCISFSASALFANEPKEPSRFSSMMRASAARPTR